MAVELFYSYAHKDEDFRQELEKHLKLLQRQGLLISWHDRMIGAGNDWRNQIDSHLNSADIILLLVSPDFLASDYCYDIEMQRALERFEAKEAQVIPIILRPCDWESSSFGKLQALPSKALPVSKWPDRDDAFLDITHHLRQLIEGAQLPTSNRVWNVPFERNPYFTGCEEALQQLEGALSRNETVALAQPQAQAISGLGGIGKTQTAVEYAFRYRNEYRYVFWLRSETTQELASDYSNIPALVGLPTLGQKQDQLVATAKNWLEQHNGWLLIFDNADDLTLVPPYLPKGGKGHVILTSRASSFGKLAHRIEIERMAPDVGALFLLRRSSFLAQDAPLDKAPQAQRNLAYTIVKEVDGLPLALEQAGAYIEETKCGLDGYLQAYRRQHHPLLQRGGSVPNPDYRETVATTWNLSFQKVEAANPAAADLLRLCAFLAPDAIPEEIITEGASELGPTLQPLSDPIQLNDAIEALSKYSLIERDPSEHTLSLHRLVQIVLLDRMDTPTQHTWAERATRAVNAVFPKVEFANWPQCQRLLSQAQACYALIKQYQLAFPEAARLLSRAARYLREQGQYTQAQPLYQRTLDIYEQVLGPEHPNTSAALNNLALLYMLQGNYGQAEPLYQRSLKISEKVLAYDDPEIAGTLNNLGQLYRVQGRYEQAEQYYRRALDIKERLLGEHLSTAITLNDLASLYVERSEYEQAERLYQHSLKIYEKSLGSDHPYVATTLDNLGQLYRGQGRDKQAEQCYQRALDIRERVLGEHPDTAITLNNLASLYRDQGKYEQAEKLYTRSLKMKEKMLAPDDPSIAATLMNMGALYHRQRRYEEAEALYRRSLALWEKVFGLEHPHIATCLEWYASLMRETGRAEEAGEMVRRARAIRVGWKG